jgi:hypothetical protein
MMKLLKGNKLSERKYSGISKDSNGKKLQDFSRQ